MAQGQPSGLAVLRTLQHGGCRQGQEEDQPLAHHQSNQMGGEHRHNRRRLQDQQRLHRLLRTTVEGQAPATQGPLYNQEDDWRTN